MLSRNKTKIAGHVSGYRQLIARGHKKGLRVIGSTNSPFENSFLDSVTFFTREKESVRQKVNSWMLTSGEFDDHPTRILPAFDSGDHIHPNDAGYVASGNAVPPSLFKM